MSSTKGKKSNVGQFRKWLIFVMSALFQKICRCAQKRDLPPWVHPRCFLAGSLQVQVLLCSQVLRPHIQTAAEGWSTAVVGLLFLIASLSLLTFVTCDKAISFTDRWDELELQSEMKFCYWACWLAFFLIILNWGRCLQGNVCINYCGVCGYPLWTLFCILKEVIAQYNSSEVFSLFG